MHFRLRVQRECGFMLQFLAVGHSLLAQRSPCRRLPEREKPPSGGNFGCSGGTANAKMYWRFEFSRTPWKTVVSVVGGNKFAKN